MIKSWPSSAMRLSSGVIAVTGWRDLSREQLVPQCLAECAVAVHLLDGSGRGNHLGPEALGQDTRGEPVVAVSVSDEDVRQVLSAALHPAANGLGLVDS